LAPRFARVVPPRTAFFALVCRVAIQFLRVVGRAAGPSRSTRGNIAISCTSIGVGVDSRVPSACVRWWISRALPRFPFLSAKKWPARFAEWGILDPSGLEAHALELALKHAPMDKCPNACQYSSNPTPHECYLHVR
jgi:hypothetical protein